ncbi:hypothetical protein K7X08_019570 [Anisodus acutangulus]|uniref:Uncharacterized protein n=1 Tax=Anisodus acutangulus TaxID=402998 RepID=A0A9Q1MXQ7_9SOLA|nr:hypothetical protein K7X08_019570 [Anisodus acutangulus]
MSTKGRKESRIKKCIKAPIRVLIKARDCYVRSMTDCSGRIGYGSAIGSCPAVTQITSLPRSFSVNSSASSGDEDFRELMRIASRRDLVNKVELEVLRQKSLAKNGMNNVVPRTRSVAIGRIDEEEPYDFVEDVMVKTDVYPRSRSYAVSSRRARML